MAMTTTVDEGPVESDSNLRILVRALWVVRVPAASIVAALFIFWQAEALDLFVDIPTSPAHRFLHWTAFYVAAILFWVLPANFSARVALQLNHERIGIDNDRRYWLLVTLLPRLLSVLCLLVIFFAFKRAEYHVPSVDKSSLAIANDARNHLEWASYWALGLCVAVTLAYLALARLPLLRGKRMRLISPGLYDLLDRTLMRVKPRAGAGRPPMFDEEGATAQHNILVGVFLLLTILFAIDILVAVIFLSPTLSGLAVQIGLPDVETYLPRAVFVPVLLGINVPGLALLGVLSHRFRLPLILGFFLALAVWGIFREWRHDVRIEDAKGPVRRIALEEAVRLWKSANGCDDDCPAPIIVAGSGGASRAAFMTGNVLARLHHLSGGLFSQRLFAISTVSGSSLGAAAFVAALQEQRAPLAADSCSQQRFQDWFACHESAKTARDALNDASVQKRVQLFLARDFLTPVFVTFTFSDMWRLGVNRAVRLERSWEVGWREVTSEKPQGRGGLGKTEGLFGTSLSDLLPRSDSGWRPLLIFNGTSVGTGRRIITTSLAPTTAEGRRIFVDAHDVYEMACPSADGTHNCNLQLSTAVLMSARFPLISPAGRIVGSGGVVDRVVDGGYFDNFGALTALELARELKAHKLNPFILQITNEPSLFTYAQCRRAFDSSDWGKHYRQEPPELPGYADNRNILRWAYDPLDAVLATRTARGYHATAEALNTVQPGRYAHIRVCPEPLALGEAQGWISAVKELVWGPRTGGKDTGADAFKSLSASWWLSMPVQQYLHGQLEKKYNCAEIDRVLEVLKPGTQPPQRPCPPE